MVGEPKPHRRKQNMEEEIPTKEELGESFPFNDINTQKQIRRKLDE